MFDIEDSDVSNSSPPGKGRKNAKEHVKQLQRLQEKDPEFYQYLKDCDKALLDFNDEDIDEDEGAESEGDVDSQLPKKLQQSSAKVITTAMVDGWCTAIKGEGKLGAVRSLLRAFRTACHCGDDTGADLSSRFSILSSSVFNKIMVFVLNEMDGILRGLLKAPSTGGKKETVMELMTTKAWKNYGSMMKLYLGNGLHILTEMTDEQMISFTLKRIKASAVFLAAFPTLLRKYIKVALHSWGTGRGALPVVSFLFLRDLCVRIGSDCIDSCLKGVYKAYVSNCKLAKSVSRSKLQHIHFLGNCVTELYGVDLPSAYQHAFVFVRQLAAIFQGAITERGAKAKDKTKGKKQQEASKTAKQQDKAYQKVYDWQFINCLELWTGIICAYNSEDDFRPLAYPLTQLIYGVACLVPTARYLPLRLRCVRMLNRIAEATGAFIPVSSLLLDMLEMKELNRIPTGGIGKAVNLIGIKQVDKSTLKTRAFQEACIYLIVEELTEHLSQWSYSVAFFEMSFIPLVRLRSFCKTTKADKFRREIKELIRQVEANSEFMNSRRTGIELSPTDPAITSFLKSGKESGSSPLSQFAANLRRRAQQRNESIVESSIIVGERSSQSHNEISESEEEEDGGDEDDGVTVFSSTWLPEKKSKTEKEKSSKKRQHEQEHNEGMDEDIVEDLILSSEDDDDVNDDGGAVLPKSSSEENGEHGPKRNSYKPARKKKKVTTSVKQDGKKVTTSVKQDGKKPKLADSSSKKKLRQRWKKKAKKGVTV